jgi:hypothetical protein
VRLEPTNVQQIGNELAIHWNDGTESYFDLQFLRRACPCAACGGEPDVLGNISRPHLTYSDESFALVGFSIVGGYARSHVRADTAPVFTVFNIYDVWLRRPDECWPEREPLGRFLSVLTYGIPTHVIRLVTRTTKTIVVLFCAVVCGAGAILSSASRLEMQPEKSHVRPILNDQVRHRIWLRV